MRILSELLQNRLLLTSIAAWFAAQALKVVFAALIDKKWNFRRFFVGLGGMPSSHSAVVCALATGMGIARGFYSVEFATCFILAMIVMTDAAGVRRAAGKQAMVLNKIVQDMIAEGRDLTGEHLKELLGHTPFQVLIGALVGVIVAFLLM